VRAKLKLAVFLFGLVLAGAIWATASVGNVQEDLFIYRAGATLPLRGLSPYDVEALRADVAGQYPGSPQLIANCGFFLTPQAVAVFTPFAVLPWEIARVTWLTLSFATFCAGLWWLPVPAGRARWGPVLAVVALADPLLPMVSSLGQTTTLMAGLLLVGYGAIVRGWKVAGALAWSVLFMKPHLALPLLPLAFALGGRRTGVALIAAVVGGNLLGLSLSPDPLGLPLEYLRHVAGGHKLVEYNRVEFNPQLTSWNNALLAGGGPLIELGIGGMLAGYAFVAAVIAVRCRGSKPDPAWLLAVAVAAVPVVCQVLAYEMLLLVGVLPLVAQRWPGTPWWRLAVLGGFWLLKSVPVETANALAEAVGQGRLGQLIIAHRSFAALGILGVALTLPPQANVSPTR
jgi:hypothetical protein